MIREEDAVVLMVDDDPDDRLIAEEAFAEVGLKAQLFFLSDGEQLLDYLNRRGKYADPATSPSPNLVLLDINMPRLSGMEVLAKLKSDPATRAIPVAMLTNSGESRTVKACYELGASSYIRKPLQFQDLVHSLSNIRHYWLETVSYPDRE